MINSASLLSKTLSALIIAFAMVAFTTQPAAAQSAKKLTCTGCVKSKQVKNNSIKGKDLKPTIFLGTSSKAGSLSVKDVSSSPRVTLDGVTGNVTNLFSNSASLSNGLVKAWATIAPDGTVVSCYRCNRADTNRTGPGTYKVDFTPLATDVRGRPRLCNWDFYSAGAPGDSVCAMADSADVSSVGVAMFDVTAIGGVYADAPFTIVIF